MSISHHVNEMTTMSLKVFHMLNNILKLECIVAIMLKCKIGLSLFFHSLTAQGCVLDFSFPWDYPLPLLSNSLLQFHSVFSTVSILLVFSLPLSLK